MDVVPMGNVRAGFRVVPEKDTVKLIQEYKEETPETNPETKPEPKPEEKPDTNSETKPEARKDGLYEVSAKALKEDSDEESKSNSYLDKVEYEIKDEKNI